MSHTYTLKEVANLLAHGVPRSDPAKVARQVRHWTLSGLLNTVGHRHTGTGNSRRYNADEVRMAALLGELARYGMSVGELDDVTKRLRHLRREQLFWDTALVGKARIFVEIVWQPAGHMTVLISIHAKDMKKVDLKAWGNAPPLVFGASWDDESHVHASQVAISLTKLFKRVQFD